MLEGMRLIFVRHGEPDYDNDCLTPDGIEQAKKTAVRLHEEDIAAVYASPMGRAVQTAGFTAEDHKKDVIKLDFMHEIDWGSKSGEELEYEGHPWTLGYELISKFPEFAKGDKWREHRYFKDNICLDYYDKIANGFDDLIKQYGLIREGDIYRAEKECDDTIAIFAHGGSGGLLISHVLGLPLPFVFTSMPYGVCSVSIIDLSPLNGDMVVPRLEIFNDMGHLGNVRKEKLRFEK